MGNRDVSNDAGNEAAGAAARTAGQGTAGAPLQGPAFSPGAPPPPGQPYGPPPPAFGGNGQGGGFGGPNGPGGPGGPNGPGGPVGPYGPGGHPGAGAPKQPMDPKKKKRLTLLAILGGVLILLVIGGSVTYSYLAKNVYGPESVVAEYLDALKEGDADKAIEMLPAAEGSETSLLTNEIFQAAENRISDYNITGFDGANGGVVTAEVTRAGDTAEHTIRVVKDGRQNVLFPKWKVEDDLMEWEIGIYLSDSPFTPKELMVNGVLVSLPEGADGDSESIDFAVLPGDYEIEPVSGSRLVSYGEGEPTGVELDSPLQVLSFTPTLTPEADTAAKAELTSFLEECLASTTLENPGCLNDAPLDQPDRYRNISWSLASGPEIDSNAGTSALFDTFGFLATDIEIVLNCEVDPTGEGDWEPFEERNTFTEFVEAKIIGDEIEISFG